MRPTPRLLWLAGAWVALGVPAVVWPAALSLWTGFGVAVLAVSVTDAMAGVRRSAVQGERTVAEAMRLHSAAEVVLRLTNQADSEVTVDVFDQHPPEDESVGLPRTLRLPADGWAEMRYRLRPTARGRKRFGRIELLVESPFGFWRRRLLVGAPGEVRVYPNFADVARYSMLATPGRTSAAGVRRQRRRGEGSEFHQLRDYRSGDSLRQVDWKASARIARVISREYQEERDQQVCFLLDCGYRMRSRDDVLGHFDHCLNALVLLAHVALRQGDSVGLMTFGGSSRFVPPQKRRGTLHTMLEAVYDLEPGDGHPDYSAAATALMQRLRRRSLVVIVTNLRDEDGSDVLPALRLLRARHLVLLASLRESVIGDVLSRPLVSFDDALRVAATHRYLLGRRKLHDAIREHGVLSVDVEPAALPAAMVGRYLEIKGSGRL